MLTFKEYQEKALDTDHTQGSELVSAKFISIALGLMSEAGEFGEKLKKIYWHKEGVWDEEDRKALAKELGDVLWYLSSLSKHVGVPLEEIAQNNIEKLQSRKQREVLQGNGDNR